MFVIIFESVALILFLFFLEFFVVQAYNIIFRGYAPFLATKGKVIKRILDELKPDEEASIYELGAGRAGFLRAARKRRPGAKLTGVEYSTTPWLIGQMQNALSGSRITMLKKNFFQVDLKEADAVYCYLNIDTMKKLEPKFAAELKPGARLISYQFPLRDKTPARKIDMGDDGRIYVYDY